MLPVVTQMNGYYAGKLYQKDDYKKHRYYNSKIVKIMKNIMSLPVYMKKQFENNAKDVRENKMQDFVKNKEFTDYNQFIFIETVKIC